MSRGLGKVEREVLAALLNAPARVPPPPFHRFEPHGDGVLAMRQLLDALQVGKGALSRAAHSLARKGLIDLYPWNRAEFAVLIDAGKRELADVRKAAS